MNKVSFIIVLLLICSSCYPKIVPNLIEESQEDIQLQCLVNFFENYYVQDGQFDAKYIIFKRSFEYFDSMADSSLKNDHVKMSNYQVWYSSVKLITGNSLVFNEYEGARMISPLFKNTSIKNHYSFYVEGKDATIILMFRKIGSNYKFVGGSDLDYLIDY